MKGRGGESIMRKEFLNFQTKRKRAIEFLKFNNPFQ